MIVAFVRLGRGVKIKDRFGYILLVEETSALVGWFKMLKWLC
jgi:hypothetical protein